MIVHFDRFSCTIVIMIILILYRRLVHRWGRPTELAVYVSENAIFSKRELGIVDSLHLRLLDLTALLRQ